MAPPSSKKHNKELPEHLIHQLLLPRLSFKSLSRFKCTSPEFHSLITADAQFAADQARWAAMSMSSFVYMSRSGLSFFPNPSDVGVPDPSLNFLNPTFPKIDLLCSTNGILLLRGIFSGINSLCVCNPATKEKAFLPNDVNSFPERIGFCYHPYESLDRYTIVNLIVPKYGYPDHCRFNVYHSDTGEWACSSQRLYVETHYFAPNKSFKAVCVKGVIYWQFTNVLLWYNTVKDCAGSITLPVTEGRGDTGVCANEITYSRTWSGGVEVWRLTGGSRWDRLHWTNWDGMMDAFNLFYSMRLRRKTRSEMFYDRRQIRPVGFDGQFVYIAVRMRFRDDAERLFAWDTKNGQFINKGVITLDSRWRQHQVFNYANSMARVPQILRGTS